MAEARSHSSTTDYQFVIDEGARFLGYKNVKDDQRKVILAFLQGNDVLACLPTGFGKSLCYSCLPVIFDLLNKDSHPGFSIVIVVSPLHALMKDQVKNLESKGIRSTSVLGHEDEQMKQSIISGSYQLIFTSPELLLKNKQWKDVFQSATLTERLVGIVVDEAHCVKKWGSDFRKEFSKLGDLRGFFPSHLNYMALTATASAATRKTIIKVLGMHRPVIVTRSPSKRNIFYDIRDKGDEIEAQLHYLVEELRILRTGTAKTIIFCRSYSDCGCLYRYFKSNLKEEMTDPIGYPDVSQFRLVDMYTASNSCKVKNSILNSFSKKDRRLRILIATVAFGMGIDCPDIRHVIHWGPPSDIEAYIQETGRGGRDGGRCFATLYYCRRDISYDQIEPGIIDYCKNTSTCRRQLLFSDFDYDPHDKPKDCFCCDLCVLICECDDCQF